jgi:hypothetical protein
VFVCFIFFLISLLVEVGHKWYTFQVCINTCRLQKSSLNTALPRFFQYFKKTIVSYKYSSTCYEKEYGIAWRTSQLPNHYEHTIILGPWIDTTAGLSILPLISHVTQVIVNELWFYVLTCTLQFSPHWRTMMNILKSTMVPHIAAVLHRNNKMHFIHSHPHCTLLPFVIHAYLHLYIMVDKKHYDAKMHTTSNMECLHCYARFFFWLHTAFLRKWKWFLPYIHQS